MDESKLAFLNELNPKIDWNLQTIKKDGKNPAGSSKGFISPARKLTKSQKKSAKRNLAYVLANESIQKKEIETVVFDNPDATWKKGDGAGGRKTRSNTKDTGSEGVELDMKKTRFEIMKFGMTGMSVEEKADAETALAISLGARSEKNLYVNYKELQETRQKLKEERELKEAGMIKPRLKASKKTGKKTKKPASSNNLSSNNVVVKSSNINNKFGTKDSAPPRRPFSGKRPDKRNREAKRKN